MFDEASFRKFLATGESVAQDAAHWNHRDTLAEHDAKYHGGMFNGGRCVFRQKGDKADILGAKDPGTGRGSDAGAMTPQDEYDSVVAKYKGTPMWMKAPNGKPTNLTERQWVQVRTPSFKRWFGDWERTYYTKGWFDVEPVSEFLMMKPIDVSSYGKADDKEHIKRYFGSFGDVRNLKDGREVRFPAKSAGRFVYVKNYVPSFKKLFETSVRAWSENETKFEGHKEHSNILRYHHYLNKFETTDGEYFVRFTVREGASDAAEGSNLVHAANVSDVEVYKKKVAQTDTLDRSATSSAGHRPHVDYKIANYLEGVNGASVSKVVDENGEPRVVWHGGRNGNDFTVFDKRKVRLGFFFATEVRRDSMAGFYGHGAERPFFIRMEKPFDCDPDTKPEDKTGVRELQAKGYDGFVSRTDEDWDREYFNYRTGKVGREKLKKGDIVEMRVFEPNQVKSATDNSGAFSNDEVSTLDEADAAEKAAEKYLRMVEG